MEDIVDLLVSEGHLTPGVPTAHGAAFAGVDVMGAAAKAVLGPALTTSVLSEKLDCRRKVLGACNPRLDPERIFEDATSDEARSAEVDLGLFTFTAACQAFLPRNHSRWAEGQARSLAHMYRALNFVRSNRPRVVVAENVDTPEVAGPVTSILARIPGYTWRSGVISPIQRGFPAERKRRFWIGIRVGGAEEAESPAAVPPVARSVGQKQAAPADGALDPPPKKHKKGPTGRSLCVPVNKPKQPGAPSRF